METPHKAPRTRNFADGEVLLVDKPVGWTSFQVVNKLKYTLVRQLRLPKRFKIGHAGTLDPLASGLLVICTGKFTKRIAEFQDQQKEYTGVFTLGATTPSYDLELEFDQHFDITAITPDQIHAAAASFVGEIQQIPPVHSAIKLDGERVYEKARRGEHVELKPRNVHIYSLEITDIDLPNIHFRVTCSKGTYIRSLAHDFGKKLDNGAHLSQLRRTKSGAFDVDDAWQLSDLVNHIKELTFAASHEDIQRP